jgi:hypothetical protein
MLLPLSHLQVANPTQDLAAPVRIIKPSFLLCFAQLQETNRSAERQWSPEAKTLNVSSEWTFVSAETGMFNAYNADMGRLCDLVVRVSGYTTEMCCVSCEVRTEFMYVM